MTHGNVGSYFSKLRGSVAVTQQLKVSSGYATVEGKEDFGRFNPF